MLFLSRSEVEELLDLDELVEALARAHAELSAGRVSMPPRTGVSVLERDGGLGVMPAYVPGQALVCKLVTLFPHNRDRETHQALIAVFDPENGSPLAVMDGTHVTAARTAAGSALATRLLARDDARVLAVLGTGVQARSHLVALGRDRDWDEVRVAGRDPDKAAALAEEFGAVAVERFEDAVRGADVVAATTHAEEPVVRREWLAAGAHVNSVGLNQSGAGEVDGATVAAALVVVESRESALAPAPAGAPELAGMDPSGLVELGELVSGLRTGRTAREQITLYKSVGVAVQDAAAAALVLAAARERDVGRWIELEELRT